MQAGQHLQMLTAQPFFAAIMGMVLQGKLGIGQPAAQRFGIDAEATSRLGHRHKGHGAPPFTWCMEQEREPAWENSWENSREFSPPHVPGNFPGKLPGVLLERGTPGRSPQRLRRLFRDGDGDNSQPNTGGCAETSTTDRRAAQRWAQAR